MTYTITLSISHRKANILQAILDLMNNIFIALILIISIILATRDMQTLILNPIERIINKIKLIADNPLLMLKKTKNQSIEEKEIETNETLIIEEAINKITKLLVLGFGQAGCRIVSYMMFENDRDLDQLVPGEMTYAIFGFCDIKQFTEVTETLLENVMLFVNTIADIVHTSIDEHGGSTNKNIGECFLVVWKLMENGYRYVIDQDFRKAVDIDCAQRPELASIYDYQRSFNQ